MSCRACIEDLSHCHGLSVEHADGSTECLGDGTGPCHLPHHLHDWRALCGDLALLCSCWPDDAPLATAGDYQWATAA